MSRFFMVTYYWEVVGVPPSISDMGIESKDGKYISRDRFMSFLQAKFEQQGLSFLGASVMNVIEMNKEDYFTFYGTAQRHSGADLAFSEN